MRIIRILFTMIVLPAGCLSEDAGIQAYLDLCKNLASKPNTIPLIREADGNMRVNVTGMLGVNNVIDVNDVKQTVTMSLFLGISWHDPSLAWNVTEHAGVDIVELARGELWMPDVLMANALQYTDITNMMTTFKVTSEGQVHTSSAFNTETVCAMELDRFPYDVQECMVMVYTYSQMVKWHFGQYNGFEKDEIRDIFKNTFTVEDVTTMMLEIPLYQVKAPGVKVTLKRRTIFYTVCLVVPMVLTSYMNTLVFLLPLQSGEKVSFLVTLSVSTSIFISFFSTEMPRGLSSPPTIMLMMMVLFFEAILFLFLTILILTLHYKQEAQATEGSTEHEVGKCTADSKSQDLKQSMKLGDCLCCKNVSASVVQPLTYENEKGRSEGNPTGEMKRDIDAADNGNKMRNCRVSGLISAQKLDRICFVVAFIGNTVVMLILWFST